MNIACISTSVVMQLVYLFYRVICASPERDHTQMNAKIRNELNKPGMTDEYKYQMYLYVDTAMQFRNNFTHNVEWELGLNVYFSFCARITTLRNYMFEFRKEHYHVFGGDFWSEYELLISRIITEMNDIMRDLDPKKIIPPVDDTPRGEFLVEECKKFAMLNGKIVKLNRANSNTDRPSVIFKKWNGNQILYITMDGVVHVVKKNIIKSITIL